MPEQILVVDCYGDVVEGAKVKRITRVSHKSGMAKSGVRVSAPGYNTRNVFLDSDPKTIDMVLMTFDLDTAHVEAGGPASLEEACTRNLLSAAVATSIGRLPLSHYLYGMPLQSNSDRSYWRLRDAYHGHQDAAWLVKRLDRTEAWRSVSGRMHKEHEDGYEPYPSKSHCSWKTNRGAPDLQLTLWRKRNEGSVVRGNGWVEGEHTYDYVLELDLDLRTGKGHVFEVVKNKLTRGRTRPYKAHEALAWKWGCYAYKLVIGDNL